MCSQPGSGVAHWNKSKFGLKARAEAEWARVGQTPSQARPAQLEAILWAVSAAQLTAAGAWGSALALNNLHCLSGMESS